MPNRTKGLASVPKGSMANACNAEVRAPVSILAIMAGSPSFGNDAHSYQPKFFRDI